jgi:hypothetical protein
LCRAQGKHPVEAALWYPYAEHRLADGARSDESPA